MGHLQIKGILFLEYATCRRKAVNRQDRLGKGARMDEPGDGDRADGFSELYKDNYKGIFNYHLYGTGDVEAAMDLTSQTFFKAFRAWPRFEYKGIPPSAWLYKIASRELAMFYRRQGRLRRLFATVEFSEETALVREHTVEEEVLAAKREVERREEFMVLSPVIRRMPEKYRVVIFLRFFVGMPLGEIAETLERPVGTIKSQLHRALKRLRSEMQHVEALQHYELEEPGKTTGEIVLGEEAD